MRIRTTAVAIALWAGGCGLAQQAQMQEQFRQSETALQADLSECKSRFPDFEKGKAAASLRCSNAAFERHAGRIPGNNADLVKLAGARSVVAAERFDRGEISRAEFDLALAQIHADFSGGSAERQHEAVLAASAAQQASAAQRQAAMQTMAAGAAILSASTPPPQPLPMPRQTNCNTYGTRTNCTTW